MIFNSYLNVFLYFTSSLTLFLYPVFYQVIVKLLNLSKTLKITPQRKSDFLNAVRGKKDKDHDWIEKVEQKRESVLGNEDWDKKLDNNVWQGDYYFAEIINIDVTKMTTAKNRPLFFMQNILNLSFLFFRFEEI